ncbi:MAG: DUF4886 domain-containing protein [Lachnospiraceae bacterium]|nr:DUF4886 domain-containing protein [Lachnospiraceae bacterium]
MKKILAIGNSFSEDATYYLHSIGEAAGVENMVVNLYIGGCPLETHWRNIEGNHRAYQYQINGKKTDRYVSIQDMLDMEEWDAIVTHQASHDSGWIDSYEPFLGLICAYLKEKAPKAELFLNETWAYETDSTHDRFIRYNRNQEEMYCRLKHAYETMAAKYELPLIPSGDLIQKLRASESFANGKRSICRDGFHMSFMDGRYAVAAMWAKHLFHVRVKGNPYVPVTENLPGAEADPEILNLIQDLIG